MPRRKRRKSEPRIGFIQVPNFSVSKADWEKLQSAYRRDVPEQARSEIYAATKHMLWRKDVEHSRPLSESIKYIARLKKPANSLRAAWTTPGLSSETISFAEGIIDHELRLYRRASRRRLLPSRDRYLTFEEFHDYLMAFAGACERAPGTATSMTVEGTRQAEDDWITDLTTICRGHSLPTGAAKDRPDNPSPFVSLVWELQKLIPSEYRLTEQSYDALAKRINKVDRFRIHTRFGTKRTPPKKNKSRQRRR